MIEQNTIIQRLRTGDQEALRILFEEHYEILVRFALQYAKDESVAKDIGQEVFVKLWKNRHALHIEGSIRSYLFKAVKNQCINYLKREKRRELREEIYANERTLEENEVDDFIRTQELEQRFSAALEKLPPKCKEIFLLCKRKGMKYKEVAEHLSISIKTVENQMGKALKILKKYLGDLSIILAWALLST